MEDDLKRGMRVWYDGSFGRENVLIHQVPVDELTLWVSGVNGLKHVIVSVPLKKISTK